MGEGLIPGSLRSVYKHHRLTLQQTHQNIWAKPPALRNLSSGRAPKSNPLSNHPSTSVVGSVPSVQTLYCFQIEVTQVVVACLSKPRQVCVTNARGMIPNTAVWWETATHSMCWERITAISYYWFQWAISFGGTPEQIGIVRWVTEAFGQTTKCYSIWLHLPHLV